MRLLALALVPLAAAASTPAAAQFVGPVIERGDAPVRGDIVREQPGDPTLRQWLGTERETRAIREDIENGREAGQLSRREARALRREGRQIGAASDRYAEGGYSYAETEMLRSRTEALRSAAIAKRSQGLARR